MTHPILGVAVTLVRLTNNNTRLPNNTISSAFKTKQLQVLMIERKFYPNAGMCAPPGGRVRYGETIVDAAIRELKEETNVVLTSNQLNNLSHRFSPQPPPTPFFTNEAILKENHYVILHYCALFDPTTMNQPEASSDASSVFWANPWELAEKNGTEKYVGVPDLSPLMKTLLNLLAAG
jgi:ADP-ribose pyrophosphatase YjhB (NUDIX family)